MKLEWRQDEQDYMQCQEVYNKLGPEEALFLTHYELEARTGLPAEQWKRFLVHPRVADWMQEELRLIQMVQFRKAIEKADDASRSVGAAQMINALSKSIETNNTTSDGQIFVYSYVPMNSAEQLAANTHTIDPDLFEFYTEEDNARLQKND